MKEIEFLQAQWRDRVQFRGMHANLMLEKDGLVLGANTRLAKRHADGALGIEGHEARLLTLLSVAYGQPIDTKILRSLNRASKLARSGDDALASMHIALAGLPRLPDLSDASRRLFIADGLLVAGTEPRDIFAALDFDPTPLDELDKLYNPDELRNPKGDGRISGEWARDIEQAQAEAEEIAGRIAGELPSAASIAARIGAGLAAAGSAAADAVAAAAAPFAFVAATTIPYPEPDSDSRGDIEGQPGLRYIWNRDDNTLRVQRVSDGETVLAGTLTPDGKLRDGPKLIGHKEGDKLVIDPFIFPDKGTDTDPKDRQDRCPKDEPDNLGRGEEKGKKDKDYEDYVKKFVNPLNPTKRGQAYAFIDPKTNKSVKFDDCQHSTGFLFEAKGTGYAEKLKHPDEYPGKGMIEGFIDQAERQVSASQGRLIYWVFAEPDAAVYVEKLFHVTLRDDYPELGRVVVYTLPWHEGMK